MSPIIARMSPPAAAAFTGIELVQGRPTGEVYSIMALMFYVIPELSK
jgi:hypothetical protein